MKISITFYFMKDSVSCTHLEVYKRQAGACEVAGAALLGGETAEHPGLLAPDEFDMAGATTGVVERDEILGPERVRPGDVVVALASSCLLYTSRCV